MLKTSYDFEGIRYSGIIAGNWFKKDQNGRFFVIKNKKMIKKLDQMMARYKLAEKL